MNNKSLYNIIVSFSQSKSRIVVAGLLILNFIIRLVIYFNTTLFYFSDYSAYLRGIENIAKGGKQDLLIGNFLFTISYIGYFAKYILGNIHYFFILNCILATLTSFIIYYLTVKITGNRLAGIITIIIHTLYTEFMVFSSVFYTPVLMIFLLSLFLLFIYLYLNSVKISGRILYLFLTILVYLFTFFFKPELKYFPLFLILFSLFFIRSNRIFFFKVLSLSFLLLTSYYLLHTSGAISQPKGNTISNAFVFFGHTNYGGDGGEGSFVYPENKVRYEAALTEYCKTNNITPPTTIDYNAFQNQEIKKFITQHPVKWIELQFTKFFRTFGVVPETTSFKVLYSGLLNENLWLTSIVVVAPVALIILLFIAFFNFSAIKLLFNRQHFLYIYCLLFFYYLIATVFYGQYQERYRLPLMVAFIIPALGYFISTFNKKEFLNKTSMIIKGSVIVLFLTVWVFQAKKAISNKQRFENAMESVYVR